MRRSRRHWLVRWKLCWDDRMRASLKAAIYPPLVPLDHGAGVRVRRSWRGVSVRVPRTLDHLLDGKTLSGKWVTVDRRLQLVELTPVTMPGYPVPNHV